jgi:archaemetzincin
MRDPADRFFWIVIAAALAVTGGVVYLAATVPPLPTSPRRRPAAPRPRVAPAESGRSHFSRGARLRRRQVFAQVQGDLAFTRLGEPRPGDWLWSFREPGQTLEEYARTVVNRKTPTRRTLHLLPFADLGPQRRGMIEPVREHTALFYDTAVKVLPAARLRRGWYSRGRGQYNADRIVRHLAGRVPTDSLGLFGLMGADLYGLGLNFVFGEALLDERAGIYSLHRYGTRRQQLLLRSLKLSAHELGHMFGLKHCVFYRCVMNGVNSLREMDNSPLHLCPVCLAKLQWNLKFDPAQRYRRLAAFYRRHGLTAQADFVAARAAELGGSP